MPEPRRSSPESRRRIAHATAMWGLLTLGTIAALAALIIWHLIRRGRLIREGLGPPRVVRLPDVTPVTPPSDPEIPPQSTLRGSPSEK
jgi:hypothetical protein